jgi:proteasome lid subunit RPN8/RPN11
MSWFSRTKKPGAPAAPPKPYWVTKVHRNVIRLVCASARSEHPNEFGGLLRVRDGILNEVLLLPGTVSGHSHAIFQLNMLPIDFSVKGTVHSHPSSNPRPSGADLELFARFGSTHIIVAEPYDEQSWRAYNSRGEPIRLEVID